MSNPEDIRNLAQELRKLEALYIADGHHRAAAACSVCRFRREGNPGHRGDEPYNFFLSVIFPHNQLRIMDYNRAVRDLHGLEKEEFLRKVEELFEIRADFTAKSPSAFHSFGMYLDGRWYELTARKNLCDETDPIGSLDVSILQNHLLEPVLGIHDPRTISASISSEGSGEWRNWNGWWIQEIRRGILTLSHHAGSTDGRGGRGARHAPQIHMV